MTTRAHHVGLRMRRRADDPSFLAGVAGLEFVVPAGAVAHATTSARTARHGTHRTTDTATAGDRTRATIGEAALTRAGRERPRPGL